MKLRIEIMWCVLFVAIPLLLISCAGSRVYENQSPAFTISCPYWEKVMPKYGEVLRLKREDRLKREVKRELPLFTVRIDPVFIPENPTPDSVAKEVCEVFKTTFQTIACKVSYAKEITLLNGDRAIEFGLDWESQC